MLITASVLIAALEIGGVQNLDYWGPQWIKLLGLVYDSATVGILGEVGRLLGGKEAEGIAARVRVQLEIEQLMSQV